MTARQGRILLVAVAFAAAPPLLGRLTGTLHLPVVGQTFQFNELRALVLGLGVYFAIAAISLNVLMGYAGQISLGHAALVGVGAFASGNVTARFELPFILGLLVAAAMGCAVALVLGVPALRIRGLHLAIVTIAFALVVENSLFRWEPISGGSAGLEIPRPVAGGFVFFRNSDYLSIALLVLLAVWVVDENIVRTKLGRAFHGIREDESVAQSFGVDVTRYKLLAFLISGAMAGMAGSVLGHLVTFVESRTFQFNVSLMLMIAVVVGGLGSRMGVVVAALLFTIMPRLFLFLQGWDQIVGAAALVFIMARHPSGVAGAIREAREQRAARRARLGEDDEEVEELPKLPSLPRPTGLPERPAAPPGAPVLEVRDVAVAFGGLQALVDTSLDVPQGKIVGLIGPNGAGKTTLFNVVSGFVRRDAGRLLFLGKDISDLPPHARTRLGIGRTFQLIGLPQNLSVTESFLLAQHVLAAGYGTWSALGGLRSAARVERELRERARLAIEALGFERFADTPVKHLSHGQKRLVEMGCALVTAPELLLLDEPSAGMAPGAAENLAVRLRDVRDELGRTVLLIEHNIPLVLDVCDYIYVLNFGRVLAHGSTDEIARRPEVLAAYFGETTTPEEVRA